jgi:hypothetical protein
MPPTRSLPLISDEEAAAMHLMMQVVSFAELVRIVPRALEAGTTLDRFNDAMIGLAKLGVARHLALGATEHEPSEVARASRAILDALDGSPLPDVEWAPLVEILGDDQLGSLVNVSSSSLTRYRSGERPTPDLVAQRLHFVAMIVSELAGSYNDFGIRRWFARPRTALDGRSPRELLTGDWSPDSPDPIRVRKLSRSLLGAAIA